MNKTITVNIPHKLGADEARKRLVTGIADLRTKNAAKLADVQETWTGNHLEFRVKAMGQAITGRLDVLDESVKLEADLPWLIAAIADRFRPTIEAEGKKMLEKK